MNIKSNYFKMKEKEFSKYLLNLKNSNDTIFLMKDKFFYAQSSKTNNLIIDLNKKNTRI